MHIACTTCCKLGRISRLSSFPCFTVLFVWYITLYVATHGTFSFNFTPFMTCYCCFISASVLFGSTGLNVGWISRLIQLFHSLGNRDERWSLGYLSLCLCWEPHKEQELDSSSLLLRGFVKKTFMKYFGIAAFHIDFDTLGLYLSLFSTFHRIVYYLGTTNICEMLKKFN